MRKVSNHNLKMNAINWGAGFVTSALFLSTLIPKMQYMITKWRTGSDAFPGTAQYRDEAKNQPNFTLEQNSIKIIQMLYYYFNILWYN